MAEKNKNKKSVEIRLWLNAELDLEKAMWIASRSFEFPVPGSELNNAVSGPLWQEEKGELARECVALWGPNHGLQGS